MKRLILLIAMFSAFAGCTPLASVKREDSIVLHEQRHCVVTVLLDLSGSFHAQMVDRGKAYAFCLAIIDSYFRDRIGERDEIIIAQISGADRALLWQGTPLGLRQEFANPREFGEFLRSRAMPQQSKVLQNFAKCVEYVASDPDVAGGKAKSAVFVLSDMIDNDPDQAAARERLQKALASYGDCGGVVGCYYVDQNLVKSCREFIAKSGIRNFKVVADIVGNPQLPVID